MTGAWTKSSLALRILRDEGFNLNPVTLLERFGDYHRLCSTWNLAAKLMSRIDIESRFDDHVADSLSLVPSVSAWVANTTREYVDIGTGGGFPALPILMCLPPGSKVTLIERSERKCAFLSQAIRQLELQNVAVANRDFPRIATPQAPTLYTARATESPLKLDRSILKNLRSADTYLAERAVAVAAAGDKIRETEIVDEFTKHGLRRGKLYSICKV